MPLEDCLIKTTNEWKKERWIPCTGNINFANLLLGSAKENTLLSSFLHISLFQKNRTYRLLGFLRDRQDSKTYQCVAEIPIDCFESKASSTHWNFPMKPSSNAVQSYWAKYEGFQFATWSQPADPNFENGFIELFSSQGYEGRLWNKNQGEIIYLVRRGKIRLIALLKPENKEDVVSLMQLNID